METTVPGGRSCEGLSETVIVLASLASVDDSATARVSQDAGVFGIGSTPDAASPRLAAVCSVIGFRTRIEISVAQN
eukprot:3568617-Rhodomonas_salina.2